MRRLLLATASALLLSGCASTPAAPVVPELPKFGNPAEFISKVTAAMREKKTASLSGAITDPDSGYVGSVRPRVLLRHEPGDRVSTHYDDTATSHNPMIIVSLPEGTFAKSKNSEEDFPARPWLRINDEDDPELEYVSKIIKGGVSWLAEPSRHIGLLAQANLDGVTQDELNGVRVVKYAFTVDLAKAITTVTDKAARLQLQRRLDKGRTSAKHEIWLSADHLPLRWSTLELRTNGQPASTDILYSDWGKPVEIVAPPAKQVR
ncbi:hypothetical protein [Crossiella cryophila]|uniref:Lipoprotein n=1 Tax=Crossiella cryophila TaxID=43355 RepID=A0A7W7C9N2_9PSEU|nr:hypothetical protein [Crossiella cryophila]MBB4675858.1 hypothetical protein [Crossiella cryophila]